MRKFQTPKNPSIIHVTWNPEFLPGEDAKGLLRCLSYAKVITDDAKVDSKVKMRSMYTRNDPIYYFISFSFVNAYISDCVKIIPHLPARLF